MGGRLSKINSVSRILKGVGDELVGHERMSGIKGTVSEDIMNQGRGNTQKEARVRT